MAGAGLDTSGVSSLLRVGLSGMTGSGSLRQVVGPSELDFLTVEFWTHGVIPEALGAVGVVRITV